MRLSPVLVSTLLLVAAAATAAEPGNLWDIATSMEMEGMKMPGQRQKVCAPVDAEGPDAMAGEDEECQVTDVQRSPGRYSYKMQCPDGSGSGVMTYDGKDSFTSVVTMTMDGETMKMSTTGKRVGSCDAGALKKKIAGMQAQAEAVGEQGCAAVAEQMIPAMLESSKCQASHKKRLCDRFATREGFHIVVKRGVTGDASSDSGTLESVSGYCGVQADAMRTRLCPEAVKADDFEFIGDACPAETRAIAQRECAGRGYTTPPAQKYRSFCNSYARSMMDGSASAATEDQAESAPARPGAADALKDGAKRLKGLFGR